MVWVFQINAMRVGFKNTPNTHFFACFYAEVPGFDTVSTTSVRTQYLVCFGVAVLFKIFYCSGLAALLDRLVFPTKRNLLLGALPQNPCPAELPQ